MTHGIRFRALALACAFLCIGLMLFAPKQAGAQEADPPIATVCVAPLERSLPDLVYVLSAMNVPEVTGVVELLSSFYTKGLDRTKPLGMIVTLDGDSPISVFCVPTSDPKQWFQSLTNMGLEAEDLGDGLYELSVANQFLMARSVDNWLFLAESEEAVESVPSDPEALFGDLPSRYNVSIRVDLEHVSPESRKAIIEQIQSDFESNVAEQFGDQLGEGLEMARDSQEQLEQLQELLNDIQQVVFGVLVDSKLKKIYMDSAIQFMPGSDLAKQMDSQSNLKSQFSKLQLPESVMDFRATYELSTEEDKKSTKEALESSLEQAQQAVARAGMPLDRSQVITEFLSSSSKIIDKTIEEGTIDVALSLSYENQILRGLAAARIADGKAIENEIKDFLQELSQTAELELDFDLETYKQWNLHRVRATLPASEQGMSELLGEKIELLIASSDTMVIASLDPDGYSALKSSIDQVDSTGSQEVTPMEMNLRVAQLIPLLEKLNTELPLEDLSETLDSIGDEDQVQVTATSLPRGMVIRIGVDADLLRLVGKVAQSGNLVPGF